MPALIELPQRTSLSREPDETKRHLSTAGPPYPAQCVSIVPSPSVLLLLRLGVREDDVPLSPELAKAKETVGATELEPGNGEAGVTDDTDLSVFDNDESQNDADED